MAEIERRLALRDLSATAMAELVHLLVGKRISHGVHRQVFGVHGRDDVVIKIEDAHKSFHNVREWETWLEVKDTARAGWFAPCVDISPCGVILMQQRVRICGAYDIAQLPRQVPACFNDLKIENWGYLGKELKCVDYSGACNFLVNAKKMRVAKWWSHDVDRTRAGSEARPVKGGTK